MISALHAIARLALAVGGPTYHETIEPLLQQHCVACHRSGGIAPFSLESYDDVAGLSAQIKEVVSSRRMPPWGADPTIGKFANDRSLPAEAIATIVQFVDAGAPRGDPAKALPKKAWPSGWSLADPPDLVLTTPARHVPAEGTLLYEYARLPTNLKSDRYVRAAEVQSSHPQLVHHVLTFLDETRESRVARFTALRDAKLDDPRPWRPAFNQFDLLQGAQANERGEWLARFRDLIARDLRFGEAGGLNGYFFSGLAGGGAAVFDGDQCKFLPAGADVVFQIHHQPNGKEADVTTSLALWFAHEPRKQALDTRGVATVVFAIPPNDPAYAVHAEYRLPAAATLRSLQPHMHRRGKDFTYVAKYPPKPDGQPGGEEVLLKVPKYDFNWQHEYVLAQPKRLPAGTVLSVLAHYDNSKDNPQNPDPTQTVYFGLQTHEEMLIGYFEVAWDPDERDEGH